MKTIQHSFWKLVLVEKGDRYGVTDCFTHDKQEPLVQFFDTRQDPKKFPKGQQAGSYFLSAILKIPAGQGLNLDQWEASAETIDAIRKSWGSPSNEGRFDAARMEVWQYLCDVEMQSSFDELGVQADDPDFVDEYVSWLLPEKLGDRNHIYGDLLLLKHKGDIEAARAEAKEDAENFSESYGGRE